MLTHNGKHKHGDLRLNTMGMLVIEIVAQSIMSTERKQVEQVLLLSIHHWH